MHIAPPLSNRATSAILRHGHTCPYFPERNPPSSLTCFDQSAHFEMRLTSFACPFPLFGHLTSTCLQVMRRAGKNIFQCNFVCGDWFSKHMRVSILLTRVPRTCCAKCISQAIRMSTHFVWRHLVCIIWPQWLSPLSVCAGSGAYIRVWCALGRCEQTKLYSSRRKVSPSFFDGFCSVQL